MKSTFYRALTNTIKNYFKKWPQNGPLSCYASKRFIVIPYPRWQNTMVVLAMGRDLKIFRNLIGLLQNISRSRIEVHFVTTFSNNFLIIFVSAFWNVDCIWFDNLPKKYVDGFQLKMYPLIQDAAKFRSICEKYKMDFYPELILKMLYSWPGNRGKWSVKTSRLLRSKLDPTRGKYF